VHSTTKYLGGHSDVLGGAVVLNDSVQVRGESLADKVGFLQFGVGAVSGPMDAWLTIRGIKTLPVRMDRHSSNAQTIAEKLVGHKKLTRVYYPGLADHPGHELAGRQMKAFGGMISVELADGPTARRFAESTTLFQLAESLGGVESLICYPAEMTHASVKGTLLEVPESIVRLSVGIEGVDDLLGDLLETLDRV
jgi:cystathionine gamma-synthase